MSPRELLATHRDAVDPAPALPRVAVCPTCRARVAVSPHGRLAAHDRPVMLGARTVRAMCDGTAEAVSL
jgi:hypothetical protein